jgi:hypothetical protein
MNKAGHHVCTKLYVSFVSNEEAQMRTNFKIAFLGPQILFGFLLTSSITACVTGVEIEIKDTSTTPNTFTPLTTSTPEAAPMGLLREVRVISDGVETGPSQSFLLELRNRLRKSGIFSDVNYEKTPYQDVVRLDLTLTEQGHQPVLVNLVDGFFSGLSLGLLSPFLPVYTERLCVLEVQAILPNGQSKTYSVKTEATMKANVFAEQQGRRQLYRTTFDKTLDAWLAQMTKDAEFYAAARAPDSDPRSSSYQALKRLDEEKYILKPTIDYSFSPFWVYIPSDLEDAYRELQKMMHPSFVEEFRETPEERLPLYHRGLGRWIRTYWGLWNGSRLSGYFNGLGITHSDDMSAIILTSFHRSLRNVPIQLDQQIQSYQAYWKKIEKRDQVSMSLER